VRRTKGKADGLAIYLKDDVLIAKDAVDVHFYDAGDRTALLLLLQHKQVRINSFVESDDTLCRQSVHSFW
jgi:hypothetical protein